MAPQPKGAEAAPLQALTFQPKGGDAAAVRVQILNGDPWFAAVDVCAAIGIANSRDALVSLDDDEKGVALTDTLGGAQSLSVVSEPGLYCLILRSRDATKPGTRAHAFRRWVTHDVLPAIRRTGAYTLSSPKDLIAKLGLVRMSEKLHGKAAAQALWTQLGLPQADASVAGPLAPVVSSRSGDWRACLRHLLHARVHHHTIAYWLRTEGPASDAAFSWADLGRDDEADRMLISFSGNLFIDSPWQGGLHISTLLNAPDAYTRSLPSIRYGSSALGAHVQVCSKYVAIPLTFVAEELERIEAPFDVDADDGEI